MKIRQLKSDGQTRRITIHLPENLAERLVRAAWASEKSLSLYLHDLLTDLPQFQDERADEN